MIHQQQGNHTSSSHIMASLEIARRKRDQQPLHSLTYRLASRRVLHERSIGSLVAVAGFSFLAAVSSQYFQLGVFGTPCFYLTRLDRRGGGIGVYRTRKLTLPPSTLFNGGIRLAQGSIFVLHIHLINDVLCLWIAPSGPQECSRER